MFYPTSDYNGQSISIRDKFFIQDLTNTKIGLVRMRQVRVKKGKSLFLFLVEQFFKWSTKF